MPGEHIWTGGNDLAKEGTWMWAGINEPFNYTAWREHVDPDKGIVKQPDNEGDEGEHCMHLYHLDNYSWNDDKCSKKYFYFICEYKIL